MKFLKTILLTGCFIASLALASPELAQNKVKIACIGDSITFGVGAEDPKTESYPAQLGKILGSGYEVRNFGKSAIMMSNYMITRQFAAAKAFEPDLIIIKLGTNDTKKRKLNDSKDKMEFSAAYANSCRALIKEFRGLKSSPRIFLCYPVPVLSKRGAIREQVLTEDIIPLITEISKDEHVPTIDLYKALEGKSGMMSDGVHPNRDGYMVIAEAVAAEIQKSLFMPAVQAAENNELDSPWPGNKSSFHSFSQYDFKLEEFNCKVVVPNKIADGKPWIWRARFWGHQPQTDKALLERGFHVVYADVAGLYGSPEAVRRWDVFYKYLVEVHGFDKKAVLEGMSRGGLIIFNWAAQNPDKVHCIYADAPVCDFKSWPGINKAIMTAYGLTQEQAKAYKGNPIDNLAPLAKAGVPLLLVVGDADKVVPVSENAAIIEKRYKALGGHIQVIHKKDVGHHPHSLKDPKPIVDFILKHTTNP